MSKKIVRALSMLLIFFTFGLAGVNAQQDVSALTGVVTDKTGAQVADANVKITDTRTGAESEATTEKDGTYHFLRLQPGPGYTLTVSKDGFQAFTVSNLYLPVASTRTQNVQLEIGSVNQTIEVQSEGSISLNTTDSTIGNNFDMRTVSSLPIEFRNDPAALLRLQPGVVNAQSEQTGAASANDPSGSRDGSVAGARADQNNITVDGIDATDFVVGQAFATQAPIPVESVQEFNTQVADITPAYGGRGGAQTVITTKSGTNSWHGSAHEYNRNAATEANTFFNNAAGVPRTNLVRNQFGADLGGPVKKDKLFFFFDYEGRRDAQQINVLQFVPLNHVKNGQIAYINANSNTSGQPCSAFSRLTSADVSTDCVTILSAPQVAALDPCSQGGGCPNSAGFTQPGIAPALLTLFQNRYPTANDLSQGDGLNTGGYRFNASNPLSENAYVTRIDYNLNSKNKLFTRFNFRHQDSINTLEQFPGDPLTGPNVVRDTAWVVGETWTARPNLVNQFIMGETRANLDQPILFNPSAGLVELSFFGGALSNPYARQTQAGRISPLPTFRDDLTWIRGRHNLQFGAQWNPTKTRTTLTNNFDFIQLGLGGSIPSLPDNLRPGDILQDTNSIAVSNWDNFFVGSLGIINNVQSAITYLKDGTPVPQGEEQHRRDYRSNLYAGYVQDTWKARQNLTITGGVRYQYSQVPYEINGTQASFVNTTLGDILKTRLENGLNGISGPDATPELTYQLTGKGNPGTPGLYKPDKYNFSPRISAAWNPSFKDGLLGTIFGDHKSVVRAQASLIYDQTVISAITNIEDQSNYVYGNTVAANFGGGGANNSLQVDPRFNSPTQVPFPVDVPAFSPTVTPNAIFNYGLDNTLHTPYSETFSFGVQRELPAGLQLEVDYFGRFGRRLFVLADAAQLVDFTDPASKHSFVQDTTTLEQLARQHTDPANIPALPFFENQLTAGTGLTCAQINAEVYGTPYSSCTQAVYAISETALQQGNLGGIALNILGVAPANVVIPSQFFVNALGTNKGFSAYNAMFVTLRKRLSRGLQFDFNYTLSHSIDNNSAVASNNGNFVGGSTQVLCNAYNLGACKGNSEFDATHQITSDFVYDLPFGKGKAFASSAPRWLDEVIGGWQTSGIITWRTGLSVDAVGPASVTSLAADAGVLFTGTSAAVRPGIHTDSQGQLQFFKDPDAAQAAFSFVTGMQNGNRDTLRGPRFSNFDLGVAKTFPLIGEKYHLLFRADAFNAFNHPNFGLPNTGIGTAQFGVLSNLAGQETARVMQFSLRLDF